MGVGQQAQVSFALAWDVFAVGRLKGISLGVRSIF